MMYLFFVKFPSTSYDAFYFKAFSLCFASGHSSWAIPVSNAQNVFP